MRGLRELGVICAFTALVTMPRPVSTQQAPIHAPDGGTRQMIVSIAVPSIPDSPFSATVNTEWTRYLDDGSTLVLGNHRTIARDGQGRVFQERRGLAPVSDAAQATRLTMIEIADPAAQQIARCVPDRTQCELQFYRSLPAAVPSRTGAMPRGAMKSESLGTQTVEGFDAVGTRETTTLAGAAVGADRSLTVTREFWYSPRLAINLSTKRTDPRSGIELFTVTDIRTSEPDPSLFQLPKGARVIDHRGGR